MDGMKMVPKEELDKFVCLKKFGNYLSTRWASKNGFSKCISSNYTGLFNLVNFKSNNFNYYGNFF